MQEHLNNPVFRIIAEIADKKNLSAYVIGGYVRDLFLQRPSTDIDVLVIGSGIELATEAAAHLGRLKVSVFKSFGTAMFKHRNIEYEFVGARKESYQRHSRKPIVEDGSLEDDQNRRDFTINAMAIRSEERRVGKEWRHRWATER